MPSVNWHAEAVITNNNANKTNRAFKSRSLEDMLPPGVDASHRALTHQTSEKFQEIQRSVGDLIAQRGIDLGHEFVREQFQAVNPRVLIVPVVSHHHERAELAGLFGHL